jgi:hypothetical protein
MATKICKTCGNEFVPMGHNGRFCSNECRPSVYKKHKQEISHTCEFCGKEFTSNREQTKFCSSSCAAKHKRRENAEVKGCRVCGKELGKLVKGKLYCSSECGKMWEKENPRWVKSCLKCGKEFKTNFGNQKYCGYECAGRIRRLATCKNCNKEFAHTRTDTAGLFCSRKCTFEYQHNGAGVNLKISTADKKKVNNESAMRRARRMGVTYELVDIIKVFERDRWTCALCGEPINKRLIFPHPMSPSLDHIVPLKRLGSHTYNNVQASHLRCNCSKGQSVLQTANPPVVCDFDTIMLDQCQYRKHTIQKF